MSEKYLLDSIECDKHNIQQLLDRLPGAVTKGEYRSIVANIKILVKEIHNTKVLLDHKVWYADEKVKLPLFEVEPSPLEGLEKYKNIDSFFGSLEKEIN